MIPEALLKLWCLCKSPEDFVKMQAGFWLGGCGQAVRLCTSNKLPVVWFRSSEGQTESRQELVHTETLWATKPTAFSFLLHQRSLMPLEQQCTPPKDDSYWHQPILESSLLHTSIGPMSQWLVKKPTRVPVMKKSHSLLSTCFASAMGGWAKRGSRSNLGTTRWQEWGRKDTHRGQ